MVSSLMVKRQKRLERIRNNPVNVRFEDLDLLLRDYGFERRQPRGGSSHFIYSKGELRMTVPMKRPFLKAVYVKQVLKLLEELDDE